MPVHFLRREFASDAAFSKTCGARCVALQPATGDQMEACSENPDAGHHGYFSIRLHFLPNALGPSARNFSPSAFRRVLSLDNIFAHD